MIGAAHIYSRLKGRSGHSKIEIHSMLDGVSSTDRQAGTHDVMGYLSYKNDSLVALGDFRTLSELYLRPRVDNQQRGWALRTSLLHGGTALIYDYTFDAMQQTLNSNAQGKDPVVGKHPYLDTLSVAFFGMKWQESALLRTTLFAINQHVKAPYGFQLDQDDLRYLRQRADRIDNLLNRQITKRRLGLFDDQVLPLVNPDCNKQLALLQFRDIRERRWGVRDFCLIRLH